MLNKDILVTGASGFLGRQIVQRLKDRGYTRVWAAPPSTDCNLTRQVDVNRLYFMFKPQIVIHAAAKVGGIQANQQNPATFLYDNAMMSLLMMEGARHHKVEKFVQIGTVCGYPKHCPVPFQESDFWNGYPEETNAPYGIAKKMMLVAGQSYRQQFGLNAIFLIPTNLYGPGDNFDPKSSHVIPALIKKFSDAKRNNEKSVTVWGTGEATREFLYVRDAAHGIVLAMEQYNKPEPVNLGTGEEDSIKTIATLIASMIEYDGEIIWDSSYPDGQPHRCLDVSRAKEEFGFTASTDIVDGIRKTIAYWREKNGEL